MERDQTTLAPPLNIRPVESYTDIQGKTWKLTDHGQWLDVTRNRQTKRTPKTRKIRRAVATPFWWLARITHRLACIVHGFDHHV